tara:strand:- start:221 stop:463 length:243 start_codon:yes stop_codon:yes gene_type:complete
MSDKSTTVAQEVNEELTKEVPLTQRPIDGDENVALNILVSFVGLAQRRGAFGLDEAAKIFECIEVFRKPKTKENVIMTSL